MLSMHGPGDRHRLLAVHHLPLPRRAARAGATKLEAIAVAGVHRQSRRAVQRPHRGGDILQHCSWCPPTSSPASPSAPCWSCAMAVAAALTLLPAGAQPPRGPRSNSLKVPYLGKLDCSSSRASGRSFLDRAHSPAVTMRHPAITLVAGVAVLLLFALPGARHEDRRVGSGTPSPTASRGQAGVGRPLTSSSPWGSVSPVQIVVDGRREKRACRAGRHHAGLRESRLGRSRSGLSARCRRRSRRGG